MTQTSTSESRQFRLAARPAGEIKDTDFELVTVPIPEPADDEFVLETTHISLDPAMRGWMSDAHSYIPPVAIGDVMRALVVGRVTASRHPGFAPGDWVHGPFGVQEHALSDGQGAYKIEITDRLTPASYLGVLGLPDKCRLLVEELGFDGAVDYNSGDLRAQLREHTPDRVDVFFDNVGGTVLNEGLARIDRGARVLICGAISQYNASGPVPGPSNYIALLVSRATMTGFVVSDFADRFPQAIAEMAGWVNAGHLRSVEDTVPGDIELFPDMLARLFTGQNTGKLPSRSRQGEHRVAMSAEQQTNRRP